MTPIRGIPIPPRMQHLDLDPRGYPIPDIILRGRDGTAHFAINDERRRLEKHILGDCCPICGGRLARARWFIGGPRSAFDPRGAYNDTPVHDECMRYAMRVCPYLATQSYQGAVGARKMPEEERKGMIIRDLADQPNIENIPKRPELFVCVQAIGQTVHVQTRMLVPRRPYRRIEFWQNGKQIDRAEGLAICKRLGLAPHPDDHFGPRRST